MPADTPSGFEGAERFLVARIDLERRREEAVRPDDFRLETMHRLLARLGDPHRCYPIVHIAGTKGKGSVAAMTAGILAAAGIRVGVYRSPHLETIRERIEIAGSPIGEPAFARLIDRLRPAVEQLDGEAASGDGRPPTFFEIITAAALLEFARCEVQIAVVEVGLGGRLDSTNVCHPLLTVITNIGIDHQRQLGPTRAAIAAEKAGIVKPHVPLICGVRETSPASVIARIAAERQAPVFWYGRDFRAWTRTARSAPHGETWMSTAGEVGRSFELRNVRLGLYGRHQVHNAALAVASGQWLAAAGWPIDDRALRAGLAESGLSGRFQRWETRPPVVLDIAHNEMSAAALARAVDEFACELTGEKVLVFAACRDKKIGRMLQRLAPRFDRIVLTRITTNPRGCDVAALQAIAAALPRLAPPARETRWSGAPDPAAAWRAATASRGVPIGLIVVCGSAYLVGEIAPVVRAWARRQAEAASIRGGAAPPAPLSAAGQG